MGRKHALAAPTLGLRCGLPGADGQGLFTYSAKGLEVTHFAVLVAGDDIDALLTPCQQSERGTVPNEYLILPWLRGQRAGRV